MFSGTSSTSNAVELSFLIVVGTCIVLLSLITFLIILFLVKYNKRRHPHPAEVKEHRALEIVWTVVPILIVLGLFYAGWADFDYLRTPPENSLPVKVTGRKWSWEFEYGNGKKSGVLRVPVGRPVKLVLSSTDVLHSFYLPAFRIKEDTVPGMRTHLWFVANEAGAYDIFCTEYCGVGHSRMRAQLLALTAGEFDAWYRAAETAAPEGRGAQLLSSRGCLGCHSTDGTRKVGPTFKGLYGRKTEVITGGKERVVVVDEEYLRKAVLEPNADIVEGYPAAMPVIPVTPEELDEIVARLKELG
ncbi:MAG: cytochrome c oxidase subunit II [Thermodesulfovibrionales bacterium]